VKGHGSQLADPRSSDAEFRCQLGRGSPIEKVPEDDLALAIGKFVDRVTQVPEQFGSLQLIEVVTLF
jgi:hypothetical protein